MAASTLRRCRTGTFASHAGTKLPSTSASPHVIRKPPSTTPSREPAKTHGSSVLVDGETNASRVTDRGSACREHSDTGLNNAIFFFLRGRYTFSVVADTQTYSMFCTLCGKGEYVQNMSVHVRAAHATPLAEVRVPLVLAHMPVHAPPIANHTHADNDDDDDDEWASN